MKFVPKLYYIIKGFRFTGNHSFRNAEVGFEEFLDLIVKMWDKVRRKHWWRIELNLLQLLPKITRMFEISELTELYMP